MVVAAPQPGEVLVRSLYSGVSRGTESLVFEGRVPPTQFSAMRCPFQDGDFPTPVRYGYSSVGVVEDGPPRLRGKRVFCLYPHQSRYVVPADAVVPLPDGLAPERAVLAANAETALNGVWDGEATLGDRIAVVGAGTAGMLVGALSARIPGTRVELVDIDPAKAAAASAFGLRLVAPREAAPGCDLVVHTSGSAAGLATALRLAAFEGTVLEMSWFGDRAPSVPLGEAFHSGRLRLRSSQVGHVPAHRRARWSRRDRLALALTLLRDDERFDALITGECTLDELPRVMADLASAPSGVLCQRVRYPAD